MEKVDKSILLISSMLFVVFMYLFLNFEKYGFDSEGELIGQISHIEKLVRRKGDKSIFWNEIGKGHSVFDGDRIFSDTNSLADIKLEGETILKVPSETLIVLKKDKDGLGIDLQHGLVDIYFGDKLKSAKILSKGKEVKIKSEKGTVAVSSSDKGLSIVPTRGDFVIEHDNKVTNLNKTNSVEISNFTDDKSVLIKSIDLIVSTPPRVNLYKENLLKAKISSEHKGKIKFDLSSSPSFENLMVVNDKDMIPEELTLALNETGNYYLRASVIQNGEAIAKTKNFKLSAMAQLEASDLLPSSNEAITATKSGGVELKWNARGDLDYIVRFYNLEGKAKTFKTPTNSITIPVFESGKYAYAVKADRRGYAWSPRREVNVNVDNYLKAITPLIDAKVSLNTFPGKLEFKWEGEAKEKYDFSLKTLIDDEEVEVFKEKISGLSKSVLIKKPGQYIWSLTHESFPGIRIPGTKFLIQLPVAVRLLPRSKQKYILNKTPFKNVQFRWKLNSSAVLDETKLVISKFEDFSETLMTIELNEKNKTKLSKRFKDLGTYYWKLVNEDEDIPLSETQVRQFKIDYPLAKLIPRVPAKQLMKLKKIKGKKGYRIKFGGVKFAKNYEVEIYRDSKLTKKVSSYKTKKTINYWNSQKDGQFFLRVRTTDVWDRTSSWSKVGRIIFPISPLFEGE